MNMKQLVPTVVEKSDLIIEYITQILSDSDKVNGDIVFSYAKDKGKENCTFDLFVLSKGFERHFDSGISLQFSNVLYEQILNDLIDNFMESDTMGVGNFYSIKASNGQFNGVSVFNESGSKINLNFKYRDNNFSEIVEAYNKKINDYKNSEKATITHVGDSSLPKFR